MDKILKPCPFCGGEAAIKEFDDGSGGIFCTKCKFQPLTHATYNRLEDKQEAIEDWNRRPDRWIPVTERLPESGETVKRIGGATMTIIYTCPRCEQILIGTIGILLRFSAITIVRTAAIPVKNMSL